MSEQKTGLAPQSKDDAAEAIEKLKQRGLLHTLTGTRQHTVTDMLNVINKNNISTKQAPPGAFVSLEGGSRYVSVGRRGGTMVTLETKAEKFARRKAERKAAKQR